MRYFFRVPVFGFWDWGWKLTKVTPLFTTNDTTLFLINKYSVTDVIQIFEHFSIFLRLKPNKSKCEIDSVNGSLWYGMWKPQD